MDANDATPNAIERPPEIKAHHLARLAVVYIRQSTQKQVEKNTGSTDFQRKLANYARALGWPEEGIEINDSDLGLSGAAAEHRPGYQRLLEAIDRGEVGAVILADMSRGGRNAADWFLLLERCRIYHVLIILDRKVHDLTSSTERLITQFLATLSEYDNTTRRETMVRGRITKAENGQAVSAPPCGYVRQPNGSWTKDSDPLVQAAVTAVFRAFRQTRSCRAAVRWLMEHSVKLPRRTKASLRWVEPTVHGIYRILTNPTYKGEYCFRRRAADPRAGRDRLGHLRLRRSPDDQVIVRPGHHEPYVSPQEWDEIQRTLRLNSNNADRRNPGPGIALCQGLLRCAAHRNRHMTTVYKAAVADRVRRYSYLCQGKYHSGGEGCGLLAGEIVDRAIVKRVIDRLRSPQMAILRQVVERASRGERSERQRRRLELTRVRQMSMLLEERFLSLDAGSVEIARDLEARLEATKRDVKRLERLVADDTSVLATFDDNVFDELQELCADIRALWDATTTTTLDRKQILRIVIRSIVLESRDRQHAQLRIYWSDGNSETISVDTTLEVQVQRLIAEMHQAGMSPDEIAARLNDCGSRTHHGNPWQPIEVARKLRRLVRNGRG